MSTVKRVKELVSGKYAGCEYYKPVCETEFWSANGLRRADEEAPDEAEVLDYRLLDEDEYNLTFWLPIGERVSFEKEFGDRSAKILCVVLPRSGQFVFRRRVRVGEKIYMLFLPADSFEEAKKKAKAAIVLGIWHKYLDQSLLPNRRVFQERERFYARKGRYPT
ncbi:MAG: hypothetical protein IJT16_08805 [Lachnospiraceae bacterium]|nr:hypothetical protein [Lachnospiraceae bacterium]